MISLALLGVMLNAPAVLCGLLFLALFVAIWLFKIRGRRPLRGFFSLRKRRNFLAHSVLVAAAVWGMLDNETVFCEAQTVTATGDTASTNFYDTGNAYTGRAGKTGENLWIQAYCSTTATSGGGATIQAVLQDSADNATYNDVLAGAPVAVAACVAGTRLLAVQPPLVMRRYWRIVWRIGTAVLTAGKFDAFISNTVQDNPQDPSGFSVA